MFKSLKLKKGLSKFNQALEKEKEKNHVEAYYLYKEALKLGYKLAGYHCGLLIMSGLKEDVCDKTRTRKKKLKSYPMQKRMQDSLPFFKEAAKEQHIESMYHVGENIITLQNTDRDSHRWDLNEAHNYLLAALEKGCKKANSLLACCYLNGDGCKQDFQKAEAYFKAAIQEGDVAAMTDYANLLFEGSPFGKDEQTAISLFVQASEKKNYFAMCRVAECFEHGIVLSQDLEKARILYEEALAHGENLAKAGLERLNRMGGAELIKEAQKYEQGTEQDALKALQLYEKAAELGDAQAQYKVGMAYYKGHFQVQKDLSLAKKWLSLAAAPENNLPSAQSAYLDLSRELMEEGKSYVPLAKSYLGKNSSTREAIKNICLAVERKYSSREEAFFPKYIPNGDGDKLYQKGRELEQSGKDYNQAAMCYMGAAKKGSPQAVYRLSCLERDLGFKDRTNWSRQAKEIRHPYAVKNMPYILAEAKKHNYEALDCLCTIVDDPEMKEILKMCCGRLCAEIGTSSRNAEALYLAATKYKEYAREFLPSAKILEAMLADHGLWHYYKGMEYAAAEDEKNADFCAQEAKKRGVLCFGDIYRRLSTLEWARGEEERLERREEEKEQRRRERELEEYQKKLDEREREINLAFGTGYLTEEEAWFSGKRDTDDALLYQHYREKKIEKFKKNQE